MILAVIQQTSLTDRPPTSALDSAANWVSDMLFGPLATTIAIIAIAWVGFAMLSGHVDIRRGLSVILGCFMLFGARYVAEGLLSAATSENLPVVASIPPPPAFANPQANTANSNAFDPYAGASAARQ
jgi:type IV secretion system protein VirB2